ncbi:MAG: AAA family ATPase [Hyphomonadaceae bacterium]
MKIARLTVENYRAIKFASVSFLDVTILLGENNCGKSTFLSALELFFSIAQSY